MKAADTIGQKIGQYEQFRQELLDKYQDPERARNVWNSYQGLVQATMTSNEADAILAKSHTSEDLEIRLDYMLEVTNKQRRALYE